MMLECKDLFINTTRKKQHDKYGQKKGYTNQCILSYLTQPKLEYGCVFQVDSKTPYGSFKQTW